MSNPIDMILHCPACGLQHVDAPSDDAYDGNPPSWTNPPHRSHLCHGCGHIWRPADVPTNGVAEIKTKGKHDSPKRPLSPSSHFHKGGLSTLSADEYPMILSPGCELP